tara:strand:- start:406 stop:540 length:135 start_codon:yes stop_codon:yes gene_type:complete
MKLAGNSRWTKVLKDTLSNKEQAEKDHILKEGQEAEEDFKRKHL